MLLNDKLQNNNFVNENKICQGKKFSSIKISWTVAMYIGLKGIQKSC